jgi:hypothetical protein
MAAAKAVAEYCFRCLLLLESIEAFRARFRAILQQHTKEAHGHAPVSQKRHNIWWSMIGSEVDRTQL